MDEQFPVPDLDVYRKAKMNNLPSPDDESQDEWHCDLFGTGEAMQLWPAKGKVPNWFWRRMQYLVLGNKWVQKG